jgi:hypothetical protein
MFGRQMSDLPVQHFLSIYETRLGMIEKGTTHPKPAVIDGVRRLVAGLRKLDPKEGIRVDANKERYIFTRASTGELVAQIDVE